MSGGFGSGLCGPSCYKHPMAALGCAVGHRVDKQMAVPFKSVFLQEINFYLSWKEVRRTLPGIRVCSAGPQKVSSSKGTVLVWYKA